jgi:hypothetical protein
MDPKAKRMIDFCALPVLRETMVIVDELAVVERRSWQM